MKTTAWILVACLGVLAAPGQEKKRNEPDAAPAVEEGFVSIFNGTDLTGWTGDTKGYVVRDGVILCDKGENLYTEKEYSDFVFRFEFRLPPGGNNGIAVRAPLTGNAAYQALEIQVLDDSHEKYHQPGKEIKDWQYHGSVYGIVAAKKGFLKPAGEWNVQEITAHGPHIKVVLNGETIVDADIAEASKDGTLDGSEHPGIQRTSGHLGFCGHGDPVEFRNLRIKELK